MNAAQAITQARTNMPVRTVAIGVAAGRDFPGLRSLQSDMPVIIGYTGLRPEVLTNEATASLSTGNIGYGETDVLTILLQVNAFQFYWLADPFAADTWAILKDWRKRRRAGIVLMSAHGGVIALTPDAHEIGMTAETWFKTRRTASATNVLDAMRAHLTTGALVEAATSDLPAFPVLSRVEASILLSPRMNDSLERERTRDGQGMAMQTAKTH